MENRMLLSFVKYASFQVLGMVGLSCYILADTYFIPNGLGADGLTALNLAIPVYSFIHGAGLMVGMGGGTAYSLAGGGEGEKADVIFTKALLYAQLLAGLFFALGLCFAGRLTSLLGADGAVYAMTRAYLRVILMFAPAFLTNNVLLCFVRNDGSPRLAMAAMLGGSFSNILLDYLFIFPCGMGMFGAALATGFAPVVSMAILTPHFWKNARALRLRRTGLGWRTAAEFSALGVPSLITEVSSGVVMILFNWTILSLKGNTGVAAYGVVANLSLVVTAVFTGLGQGIQPLVSASLGREQPAAAERVYRYALAAAAGFALAVCALTTGCAGLIAGAFNREGDPILQQIAVQGLKLYFTGFLFAGFNIVSAVYSSSRGEAGPGFVISMLRGLILILPLSLLLPKMWGMTGVWLIVPTAEGMTALAALWMLVQRRKAEKDCRIRGNDQE